jgi:hypothetical protein
MATAETIWNVGIPSEIIIPIAAAVNVMNISTTLAKK